MQPLSLRDAPNNGCIGDHILSQSVGRTKVIFYIILYKRISSWLRIWLSRVSTSFVFAQKYLLQFADTLLKNHLSKRCRYSF